MAKTAVLKPFLAVAKDKFTINTIEDMIGRRDLALGDVVELNGYYTAGDGAGHKRKIEATDDGSGVQLDNGLYANIVHNGEVNISWFGAKGDGVTDDTDAIQKAANVPKCINLDSKTYIVSKTLVVRSKKFSGGHGTTIKFNINNNADNCFETHGGCELSNLGLRFENTGLDGIVCKGETSSLSLKNINTYDSYRDAFVLDAVADWAWKENTRIEKVCVSGCGRHGFVFKVGGRDTFINETTMLNIEVRTVGKNYQNSYPFFMENVSPPHTPGKKIGGLTIIGANFDVAAGVNWGKSFFSLKDTRLESFFLTGGGFEALGSGGHIFDTFLISDNPESVVGSVLEGGTILSLVHYNASITVDPKFADRVLQWTPSQQLMPVSLFNSVKSNYNFYSKNNDVLVDLKSADNSAFHPVAIKLRGDDLKKIIIDKTKDNGFSLEIDIKGNPHGFFYKGNRYFKYIYSIRNQDRLNPISKIEYSFKSTSATTYLIIWLKGGLTYSFRQLLNYTEMGEIIYNKSGGAITIFDIEKNVETSIVDTKFNNSHTYDINNTTLSGLDTPYHATKMQEEGVYNDFIQYMDEKTEYDRLQRELEQQPEGVMMLPVIEEPQPSEKLLAFKEKYLG